MNLNLLDSRWILWAVLAWLLSLTGLFGCASRNTVDTTKFAEAVAAGEGNGQLGALSGDLIRPDWAGKLIVFPSAPGKDLKAKLYYPDGTVQADIDSRRSAVIDMLAASAMGIDGQKYAQDAIQWSRFESMLDRVEAASAPWMQLALQRATAPKEPGPTSEQRLAQLEQGLGMIVGALKDAGIIKPPATAPAPR